MLLFDYYFFTIKPISMVLFYTILGLLFAILIINNRLYDAVNTNDVSKFNDSKETLIKLIWINYSIQIVFFIYLLIGSLNFINYFNARFRNPRNVRNRSIMRNIILLCMIIISTGLIYYINQNLKDINTVNVSNAKDVIFKIDIIIPIITIISMFLLMENFGFVDNELMSLNRYINIPIPPLPVTRSNSPVSLNSPSEDDVPHHFRTDLPNRYSPHFIDDDF
jgi:hypothetical protein